MWSKYTAQTLRSVLTTPKESSISTYFFSCHSEGDLSAVPAQAEARRISSSIILIFTFYILHFLFACASAPEKTSIIKPETTLEIAALTKDVEEDDDSSSPSGETETFFSYDPQAILWVRLKELYGEHDLRWEWYDPKGNLYHTTGNYKINKDGKYRKSSTSWHKIAIKDEEAGALPGKWLVKVVLDNEPVATKEFEIKRSFNIKEILSSGVKARPDRSKWAVIIGIEKYRKTSPVQFAENDANTMKEYLKKYIGVPEENIITMINDIATKGEIEVIIKDRLKGLLKEGDTLYFYYTGHGIPAEETPYLLPYDGDPESPKITAYPVEELYKDLDQLLAKEVYVFMDTCFSGRTGREEKEKIVLAGARPGILKVKDPLLLSKKVVVLAAAKSNQLSNYYKEEGYGLFTYYLLKGMIGEADRNDDRKVQIKELIQYVEDEVGAASRRLFGLNRQQNPVAMPAPLGEKEEQNIAIVY